MQPIHIQEYTAIHASLHKNLQSHTYAVLHTHTQSYTHIQIYSHMHKPTHTCTNLHTHTNRYTYTHCNPAGLRIFRISVESDHISAVFEAGDGTLL